MLNGLRSCLFEDKCSRQFLMLDEILSEGCNKFPHFLSPFCHLGACAQLYYFIGYLKHQPAASSQPSTKEW